MAHPAPGGAVPADVGEAAVEVPVGRAEGHLLNGLVHDEALRVVVHHAEAVPVHVEDGANRFALRILKWASCDVAVRKKQRISAMAYL